jgi:hypothetical protein
LAQPNCAACQSRQRDTAAQDDIKAQSGQPALAAPPVPTSPAATSAGQTKGMTRGAQQAAHAAAVPVMASFRETMGFSDSMSCNRVTLQATLRAS